jgi:ubiquinone/menaquinone biosynthesis C-methylase UbiE
MCPASNLLSRLLRLFFYLIYQPLAWSYDLVAWVVSLGQWNTWILSTLPWLPGPRILELGHGTGHLQLALHQKMVRVIGLDQSRQMGFLTYRRLRKAGSPGNLSRGVAQHIPYAAASFEQVVSTFPSEYIVQPETLSEIRRVLRPNGRLVVLPVAWIRSQRHLGRLAAWLFRVTGQAESWNALFSEKFRIAGFLVEEEHISLPGSELVILIAAKAPDC